MAGTWTYDPALIATTPLYQVRRLIGDVNTKDQQLFDEEVNWELSQRANNVYAAGSECCRLLATKYSRDVDVVEAELRKAYSARSRAYSMRAVELARVAKITGKGVPYAGAISIADKMRQESNSDRVPPQFQIGMFDNWSPVPPTGNESENYPGSK